MTTIYFDKRASSFGQVEEEIPYYWGLNFERLPLISKSPKLIPFKMKHKSNKLGPLVGILTSDHPKRVFAGNVHTFLRIDSFLKKSGGLCFVFTPSRLKETSINGLILIENKWTEVSIPLPDIIYNRVPTIASENSIEMKQAFQWIKEKMIPFFNPHFFEKWEIYKLLSSDNWLKNFLPDTAPLVSIEKLQAFLTKHKKIYVKPTYGQKGNGIFTILVSPYGTYQLQNEKEVKTFFSFNAILSSVHQLTNNKTYLIQQAIPLQQYKGKNYDFRIHVQKAPHQWQITGIGVRCAKSNAITTHVPKGGEILSLHQIYPPIDKKLLHSIIIKIATKLEKAYGTLGEFSLDIGRDPNGNYWIFEINSKPMIFDEPSIQKKGLSSLIQTFYLYSDFL